MSLPRLNINSSGWWVLQNHDAADLFSNVYGDDSNLLINYAARYTWSTDADGFPAFGQAAATYGPVAGWICWPKAGARKMAQWAQVFPAKITTASPLKATPVKGSSGWNVDTSLGEVQVATSDGSSPAVDTFGLVVAGSDLHNQRALFFQGGGGSTLTYYKIQANHADGTYLGQQVDYPGSGYASGSGPVDGLTEMNQSIAVPINQIVRVHFVSNVGYFDMPFGCP